MILQKLINELPYNQDVLDLITETSGRHTKRNNITHQDYNDERPPTRINSKHNLVCVEDDIVEVIAACIVMHVRDAASEGYLPPPEYASFTKELPNSNYELDCTLENVKYVINVIHNETKMEYECMIIAFIYLERMCLSTNKKFRICVRNWRYSLFATLMLASKTWDDFALTNYQYSNIFSNLDLRRINKLEIELLLMLNFTIGVSSEQFHEYYNYIYQLITASNLRRIQNKLEKHMFETSASIHTSSSVSLTTPIPFDKDSDHHREIPVLCLRRIPSDRYDMSRVGGMCVLLERDLSSRSSKNGDSDKERAVSRGSCDNASGSVVSLDDSGKIYNFKGLLNSSPSQQKPVNSKGSVFSNFQSRKSNKVLPSIDQECNTAVSSTVFEGTTPVNGLLASPAVQSFTEPVSSETPKPKQITEPTNNLNANCSRTSPARASVLKTVSSTLFEMRLFFANVFHSSDRVYADDGAEKPEFPSDSIQVARTYTHSEYSMSHRVPSGKSVSSRNSSWKTMRTKQQSEGKLLTTKFF